MINTSKRFAYIHTSPVCLCIYVMLDEEESIEAPTANDLSIIMGIIYSLHPEMKKQIKMEKLLPYLMRYKILTGDEENKLGKPFDSNTEKVQCLLSVMEGKGPEGEENFIKALYESSKESGNTGHKKLIEALSDKGIDINESLHQIHSQ